MYTIIKDCSPYYITFIYEGLPHYIKSLQNIADKSIFKNSNNNAVNTIKELIPSYNTDEFYVTGEDLQTVINNPCVDLLNLDKNATYLRTYPGVRGPVHTDENGKLKTLVPFRINYPVFINDDKCITSWYSNDGIVNFKNVSYLADDKLSKLTKLASTHITQDHAILFNTSFYHDWDNTQSNNFRTILGIRPSSDSTLTFDDARKLLFGI